MGDPLIITVAGIGAELTKADTPYLPSNPDEILEEAVRIEKAGAQVFHLHVRDHQGRPTLDRAVIDPLIKKIRAKTKLILQISTGGAIGDREADRLGVLECNVEMASLTLGSVNFGKEVFENPLPLIEKLASAMKQKKIRPELEVFDAAMPETAAKLLKKGLLTEPLHFNIILGGPGWLAAKVENLEFILKKLPAGATWSASGVGAGQLPMIDYAISHGGHARTGLEDNIYLVKGVLAKGNVELVAQVKELAGKAQRRLATIDEARKILCPA
ncbi:MAG: 3-keto-5-aminohexanoate cleavage protein [Deltaproteobacteria bacterium]|nr:3-keto-5-aminohexanoate cleavage protein [Deltaproteobacteria bacterium]